MGYYQSEADAFDDALAKTNTLLNSMRKRLDEVDAIEDKSKAMAEFKLLSRCAGELQNAWAEKHLRASRKVGQLLERMAAELRAGILPDTLYRFKNQRGINLV